MKHGSSVCILFVLMHVKHVNQAENMCANCTVLVTRNISNVST